MDSLIVSDALSHARVVCSASAITSTSSVRHQFLHCFLSPPIRGPPPSLTCSLSKRANTFDLQITAGFRKISAVAAGSGALMTNSVPPKNGIYTVGDFMTKKEDLHVVKPTTTVDEALEALVENRITGFPVIDDDWKLVGLVSDYDLLALDSISGASYSIFVSHLNSKEGSARADTSMFPEVDSTWKTFNEIQKLLVKTNGKVIADVMTPAPLVVRETTNLEDAARLLLETKYRRLPVVDSNGKLVKKLTTIESFRPCLVCGEKSQMRIFTVLVGIITRGNVVRAALHIKREIEKMA